MLNFPLLDIRSRSGEHNLTARFISDLVVQTLAYVAQKERESIRQRQAEEIAAAKAMSGMFSQKSKENQPT